MNHGETKKPNVGRLFHHLTGTNSLIFLFYNGLVKQRSKISNNVRHRSLRFFFFFLFCEGWLVEFDYKYTVCCCGQSGISPLRGPLKAWHHNFDVSFQFLSAFKATNTLYFLEIHSLPKVKHEDVKCKKNQQIFLWLTQYSAGK